MYSNIWMRIFHLSFGVFAATVGFDNGWLRQTVKGNQATAVERVECLSLAQPSNRRCMCWRQWLGREFREKWKLEEKSSPRQSCEPLGRAHPLYASDFYPFFFFFFFFGRRKEATISAGLRLIRGFHSQLERSHLHCTLTLETTEHMSTSNTSFVVIVRFTF